MTLLDMFDEINFTDPSKLHFNNPAPIYTETKLYSIQELRAALQLLIERVRGRVAFLGTPRAHTPAIETFYLTIEHALRNCVATLRANPQTAANKLLQDRTLLEIIRAAPKMRWKVLYSLYKAISSCLQRKISDFRR